MSQSRLVSLGVAAFALASTAVAPLVASAEPDPPRPVCRLTFDERTISSSDGTIPDVTYPHPRWIC